MGFQMSMKKIKYNLLKCIISHVIGEEVFHRRKVVDKTACEHGTVGCVTLHLPQESRSMAIALASWKSKIIVYICTKL